MTPSPPQLYRLYEGLSPEPPEIRTNIHTKCTFKPFLLLLKDLKKIHGMLNASGVP